MHHNECDSVSNHQHLDCLLNRMFRHRSKKTSKLHDTGLCEGNPPATSGFPSQRPVKQKMFPFDYIIMMKAIWIAYQNLIIMNKSSVKRYSKHYFHNRHCRCIQTYPTPSIQAMFSKVTLCKHSRTTHSRCLYICTPLGCITKEGFYV